MNNQFLLPIGYVSIIIISVFALSVLDAFSFNVERITGHLTKEHHERVEVKVVTEDKPHTPDLFDLVLEIPDDIIKPEEPLQISIDLINFGTDGHTHVKLNYYVTDEDGNLRFVQHDTLNLETQIEFLENLNLSGLPPGNYHLLVELLYSDLVATASHDFMISRMR